MDETFKQLILQMPMVAVLLYAIQILYIDMKADRVTASAERKATLEQIGVLVVSINAMTVAFARLETTLGKEQPRPIS